MLIETLIVIAISLVVAVLLWWVKKRDRPTGINNPYIKRIPGPGTVPDRYQGNLQDIINAKGLIPYVKNLHEEHGPVIKFWLNGVTVVVSINSPEYLQKTAKIGTRPKDLFEFLSKLLGPKNLQIYSGGEAKLFRGEVVKTLGHTLLSKKYEQLFHNAQLSVKSIGSHVSSDQSFGIQNELLKFGLRSVLDVLCKDSLQCEENFFEQFKDAYDEAISGTWDAQLGVAEDKVKKLDKSIAYVHKLMKVIIANRKAKIAENEKFDDFLQVLLTKDDPLTGKPYTEEMLLAHLTGFILAAYHTSVVSASWCIFELTQHLDIQKKVQNEIDTVLGKKENVESTDLAKLQYLKNVINETLRLHTPGPFAARQLEENLVLGQYTIPSGTTLFYPLSAIHVNASLWNNPTKFEPERFESKIRPFHFVPFGVGVRSCPGDKMALLEMKLLLALLLRQFTFELATDLSQVIPAERFVLWAEKDIIVNAKRRK